MNIATLSSEMEVPLAMPPSKIQQRDGMHAVRYDDVLRQHRAVADAVVAAGSRGRSVRPDLRRGCY